MIGVIAFVLISLWTLALIARATRFAVAVVAWLFIKPIRIIMVPTKKPQRIIEIDLSQGE